MLLQITEVKKGKGDLFMTKKFQPGNSSRPPEIPQTRRLKKRTVIGVCAAILGAAALRYSPMLPPKNGAEALQMAETRIETSYVSRAGLFEELSDIYSEKAAEYALDNLENADWNQEALEAIDELSADRDMSLQTLQDQLTYEQFEPEEIDYAFSRRVDSFDFEKHAVKALTGYSASHTVNRTDAADYLSGKKFEETQIRAAVQSDAVDWKKSAKEEADELLKNPCSETLLREKLLQSEYQDDEIAYALNTLKPDFDNHCLNYLKNEDADRISSESSLKKKAENLKFSTAQIQNAFSTLSPDWKYNAVRFAGKTCSETYDLLSRDELSSKILAAGFTDEQNQFVLKYYDETAGTVDDEETIRQKIREEEEAKKKAEEDARQKAAEEQRKAEEARIQQEQQKAQTAAPESNSLQVWIPRTGSKYHSSASCSNMKNPSQVSLDTAVAQGFERCKKCW